MAADVAETLARDLQHMIGELDGAVDADAEVDLRARTGFEPRLVGQRRGFDGEVDRGRRHGHHGRDANIRAMATIPPPGSALGRLMARLPHRPRLLSRKPKRHPAWRSALQAAVLLSGLSRVE